MAQIISKELYNVKRLANPLDIYFGDDGIIYVGTPERKLKVYLDPGSSGTSLFAGVANTIEIAMNLSALGIVTSALRPTGVIAGTYGNSTNVGVFTVDANGRITGASNVPIASGGVGTVTSVGLSMPSAFNVASSPIITNGTIAVTGAGTTAQYIRGDGSLDTFPTIPSGTVISIATAGLISGGNPTPITTTGTITTSMNTSKLVGRGTAGVGIMEEITLGTNLSLSGTTLNATGGGESISLFLLMGG